MEPTVSKKLCCDICDFKCRYIYDFERHVRSHLREKPYFCKICSKELATKPRLKAHLLLHNRIKSTSPPNMCPFCYRTYPKKPNLFLHILRHTKELPFECKLCDFSSISSTLVRIHQISYTSEKDWKCNQCGKVFKHKLHLQQHIRIFHTIGRSYSCTICDFTAYTEASLNAHSRTHTGEKVYKCDKCVKCFTSTIALNLHLGDHDPELKKSQARECKICNKILRSLPGLRDHLKTHSDLKQHRCEICDKEFRSKGSLKSHTVTHTGEKTFECRFCPKKYGNYTSRRIHEDRCHTEGNSKNKCPICSQDVHKTYWTRHLNRHNQVKSKLCIFCNKGCVDNTDYLRHIRCHTREAVGWCKICGKELSDDFTIKKHTRIYHST